MNCNRNQLNITRGSDVILNVTLEHEGEVIIPALIDGLEVNLISGLGARIPLTATQAADYIVVNIPWSVVQRVSIYSLEVKGSINGLAWAAIGKGLIRYTNATEAGAESVTVEADAYDVTMEAGYHYSDSPIAAVHVSVDDEYGTPSADVTYQQRVLGLDFHNLRGNGITEIDVDEQVGDEAVNTITFKTDADPEGTELQVRNGSRGNGIASSSEEMSDQDGGTNTFTFYDTDGGEHKFHSTNGKKGTKGDSVIVGQGDLPLTHELGQSYEKAISQKGVTDVVNDMMKKTEENGFFFTDSNRNIGAWMDSLGFHAPNLVEMSALSGLFWQIIADVFVDVEEDGFYVVDSNRNIGFMVNNTGAHSANLVEY